MMKSKFFFITCLLLFLTTFSGCFLNHKTINIEKAKQKSINEKWAVVTTPNVVYKIEPDNNAKTSSNGRKGDIQIVMGKRICMNSEKEQVIWLMLESGWTEEQNLYICNNKLQAENYSKNLIKN